MKKAICIMLSILFIFTLISCNNQEEKADYKTYKDYETYEDDDITVYVSKYGKIHAVSNCSGMKHYATMTYYEALNKGYVECKKCRKKLKKALESLDDATREKRGPLFLSSLLSRELSARASHKFGIGVCSPLADGKTPCQTREKYRNLLTKTFGGCRIKLYLQILIMEENNYV